MSARAKHTPHLTAVHVGEVSEFRDEHPGLGSPRERARLSTAASLHALDVREAFDDVRVLQNDSAVESLLREATPRSVRGMVLGRNQPSDGWSLSSLGSVARRVLRAVDDPVFIIPPDYEPDANAGPIVVGVTATDNALAALRFAETLGQQFDLPIECVHVIPDIAHFMATPHGTFPSAPTALNSHESFQRHARATIEAWMRDNGVEHPLRLEAGDIVTALEGAAQHLGATMVVTGSRQLSTIGRLFQRSVGSDLASRSAFPTLVVPPPGDETPAQTYEHEIEALDKLLRGELAAVETYDQALDRVDGAVAETLSSLRASHQLRAEQLHNHILLLGGEPSEESGAWGVFARLVEGGATLISDRTALEALEAGEKHGKQQYDDLPALEPTTRAFVQEHLRPQQEFTYTQLSKLIRRAS